MGNAAVSHRQGTSTGKLILSDGTIHEFKTPITAAELMLDHPRHVVVEISRYPLPSLISGTGKVNNNYKHPIIPLPADKNLEKDKIYFMVPMKNRGKTTSFSLQEIQRLVVLRSKKRDVNSVGVLSSATGFVPLLVRFVCTVGSGSEIESIVKMSRKGGRLLEEKKELITSGEEEIWPEYVTSMRPQLSGKRWKPSLDTIVEMGVKPNVRHWLV